MAALGLVAILLSGVPPQPPAAARTVLALVGARQLAVRRFRIEGPLVLAETPSGDHVSLRLADVDFEVTRRWNRALARAEQAAVRPAPSPAPDPVVPVPAGRRPGRGSFSVLSGTAALAYARAAASPTAGKASGSGAGRRTRPRSAGILPPPAAAPGRDPIRKRLADRPWPQGGPSAVPRVEPLPRGRGRARIP